MSSPLKYIFQIMVFVILSILAFDSIANMLFGSLGKTTESPEWNYILTLYIFLASLGAIALIANLKSNLTIFKIFQPITTVLSATLSFALLGFYYGGSTTDNNPQIAILTAIALGIVGTILSLKYNQFIIKGVTSIATIAAYGFAFYAVTNASAYFSVANLFGGISWGIICLIYLSVTIKNLMNISNKLN